MAAVLDGKSKANATGFTTTIASALTTAAALSRPMELENIAYEFVTRRHVAKSYLRHERQRLQQSHCQLWWAVKR